MTPTSSQLERPMQLVICQLALRIKDSVVLLLLFLLEHWHRSAVASSQSWIRQLQGYFFSTQQHTQQSASNSLHSLTAALDQVHESSQMIMSSGRPRSYREAVCRVTCIPPMNPPPGTWSDQEPRNPISRKSVMPQAGTRSIMSPIRYTPTGLVSFKTIPKPSLRTLTSTPIISTCAGQSRIAVG
ncbi:hypothetical protein JHW43_000443 [Diplocarpon mali]|nr:hypothetical protein JHW43_000443 [Diplocarpon mali]